MKKFSFLLSIVVIAISFSSCGTTYHGISGGSAGCGVWYPKKFERDNSWKRAKIRSNPNSAYNRMGRGW
jgi:hypothetical protein